jgi:hypothetical protein
LLLLLAQVTMKRIRGRRVALLLASAFPLLAEDDIFSKEDVPVVTPPDEENFVQPQPQQQQKQDGWNALGQHDNNEEDEEDTSQVFTAAATSTESVTTDSWNDDVASGGTLVEEESSSFSADAPQYHDDDTEIQQHENDHEVIAPLKEEEENKVGDSSEASMTLQDDDDDTPEENRQRLFEFSSPEKMSRRRDHMFANVVIPLRPYENFYDTDDNEPWKKSADEVNSNATTSSEKSESASAVNATDATATTATDTDDSSSSEPEFTKESAPTEEQQEPTRAVKEEEEEQPRVVVDYASRSAGALVLEKSANFQGTSNLLTANRDQYAIVECQEEQKFVVIGLSEDILVKQVVLANYERYSSHVKEFKIQVSTTMGEWIDLGMYTAQKPGASKNGKQVFDLKEPSWARYLKFHFLTHYGNEHYCTISQISVHGSTMLQGFHEQWSEEESAKNEANVETIEGVEEQDAHLEDLTEEATEEAREESPEEIETRKPPLPLPRGLTSLADFCSLQTDFPKRLSFEQNMTRSAMHNTDAIASFSVGLSARIPSALSQDETTQRYRELSQNGLRRSTRQKTEDVSSMLANAFTSRPSSFLSLTDSPVVKKIRGLIKSATGVDVSLDKVGRIFLVGSDEMGVEMSGDAGATVKNKSLIEQPEDVSRDKDNPLVDVAESAEDTTSKASTTREKLDVEARGNPSLGATNEAILKAAIGETDHSLARALERLPNAGCLKDLDFATFKMKHLNVRAGSGSNSGAPAGHAMEPIFKKLTDEIKALQANVGVHDMYATESIMCYQRVILDLMAEMETLRSKQDERISLLEQKSDWAGRFIAWARYGGGRIVSMCRWSKPRLVAAGEVVVATMISLTAEGSDIPTYAFVFVAVLTCYICYLFVCRTTRALFCSSEGKHHINSMGDRAGTTYTRRSTPPLI